MDARPFFHRHSLTWARTAAVSIGIGLLTLLNTATAHHSYAMFDASKTLIVNGTVAKFEWMNPHVFLWLYVPHKGSPGKYDLYAFENGSVNGLTRVGWSATVLKAGEKITVEYWPLRDGRLGGHLNKATLPDDRVLLGVGGPEFRDGRAPRPEFELPKLVQTGH